MHTYKIKVKGIDSNSQTVAQKFVKQFATSTKNKVNTKCRNSSTEGTYCW